MFAEIPREEWSGFFENFSDMNRDKIVKVEIIDDEDYRIDYAEALPFQSVSITAVDGENTTIEVTAGNNNSFRHLVDMANIVLLENTEDHHPKLLQIKSSLGRNAIIRFHPLEEGDDAQ